MRKLSRVIIVLCFSFMMTPAMSQSDYMDKTGKRIQEKTSQKLKRKSKAKMGEGEGETRAKEELKQELIEKIVKKLPWLPDWGTPNFDWYLSPILGFNLTKAVDDEGKSTSVAQWEGGLALGLSGIPLVPGNPGLYLAPYGQYASGRKVNSGNFDIDNVPVPNSYKRYLVGLGLELPVRFYRHQLNVEKGAIEYEGDSDVNVHSLEVRNDFGVMVLPHISAHYTNTYLIAYIYNRSNPELVTIDNWLHMLFRTDFLSFFFDFGPGVLFFDTYGPKTDDSGAIAANETEKIARSRLDYFKAQTGLHLFWKLGMSGGLQYIYKVSEEENLNSNDLRLPKEDLNSERTVFNQGEDSLKANLFLGLQNIIYGMSVGWQYNVQIENATDDKNYHMEKNHGFGIRYQVAL